jgi:Flp pilus assembly protein TadG
LAGALALAACGSDDAATDTGASATEAPAAETAPSVENTEAPEGATPADTGSASAATTAPSAGATTPGTESASVEVPEVLQFSSALVGGGELDLATLAGRPVLLWFWAPF